MNNIADLRILRRGVDQDLEPSPRGGQGRRDDLRMQAERLQAIYALLGTFTVTVVTQSNGGLDGRRLR